MSRSDFVALPLPLVLLTTLVIGCGSDGVGRSGGDASGPTLVPVDSLLLEEADSLYMGRPWTPAVDPRDGSIYIPDGYTSRVYRFDRSGRLVQTYGSRGSGPGELRGPNMAFVLDDTILVVLDARLNRLKWFHRDTGVGLAETVFTPFTGIEPAVRVGDHYWFASVEQGHPRALARWDPRTGEVSTVGPMPAEYHVSRRSPRPGYANNMLVGVLTWADSTLIRGWQIRNDLMRYTLDGEIVDTIDLPAVRRRGVPENLRYLYDVEGATGRERLTINSYLRQLHTLPGGGLAFVHHDQEILSLDGPVPILGARSWLGITTPDFQRACVDAPVPASSDARPMETFRGDTLLVLDRRIVGERLETWIRMFRIDTTGCDWLPTR